MPSSLSDELAPGHVVERYEVEELLGEGAMAAVYRVRHTTLGTHAALKLLTYSRSRAVKERMVREGRTQASLQHPNIVQVYDVFDVDGMPALLLEYVSGPTLEQFLADELVPLDEAEAIFRGIVAGVMAAHDKGLVHRDLKPANILLQPTATGFVPKVADFGLAKAWADDAAPSHTRAGTALGTPQYMAPEQATNARDVDHRADVFALGCIFYELICGRQAFDGENLPSVFNQVLQGDYPPPKAVTPGVPDHYQLLVDACLEVKVDQRLQSCKGILQILDGTMPTDTPVPGRPAQTTWSPGELPAGSLVPPGQDAEPEPEPEDVADPETLAGPTSLPATEDAPAIEPAGPEPKAPAPALVLAAVGLPAVLGGAAVMTVLLIAGVVAGFLLAAPSDGLPAAGGVIEGPCGGPAGEVVGYAWAGRSLDVEQGGVWTIERDTNVRQAYPHEDNNHDARTDVVCVLRAGTRVRIDAPLEHPPGAVWVPVVAGSVEAD